MDKWLRNNNVVKVLALAIGILLWIVVHMDVPPTAGTPVSTLQEQKINNVSITPKYNGNDVYVKSIEPAVATVTLRGKPSTLRGITTSNFQVQLDLSKATTGTHSFPLNVIGIPSTVIFDVQPAIVQVVLENMEKKEVPVVITLTGTAADGFKPGQPVIKPNRVHVTVPTSRLDEVESARAEISVEKANSAITKQVKLVAYGKNNKPIEGLVNPQLVDVEIPITIPLKIMPLQIRLSGQPAKGFSVASLKQTEQVTVFGPQSLLDKMDFYEGPQIDLTGLREDKQFSVEIPVKNKAVQVDPTKVDIQLVIVPSATKALEKIPLILIGQNDGFITQRVSPESGLINVTVEGAPALLDKLKSQDVQAIVDVSNLPPGRHELNASLKLPAYIQQADSASTVKVIVNISAKPTPTPSTDIEVTPTPSADIEVTPTPPAVTANP